MSGKRNLDNCRSRDLAKIGQLVTNNAVQEGHISYSTAATLADRWRPFAEFSKHHGVKHLQEIDHALVRLYADQLVGQGKAPSTCQNAVSAINTILSLASSGRWEPLGPVSDCGLDKRSSVRKEPPQGIDREQLKQATVALVDKGMTRGTAVITLCRELGLRSKEASLIDSRRALDQASSGAIIIDRGTKGGRARTIPITIHSQRSALAGAANVQGNSSCLVPSDISWAQWRDGELRRSRDVLKTVGISRIHELRAAYAAERYQRLTGQPIPLLGGAVDRDTDEHCRQQIARELGHSRVSIVAAYIGGRK